MAILYVAAEADELKPFANHLTALRKLNWPLDYAGEGILDGRRVLLAANGAGPKLAARAVEIAIRSVTQADLSASRLEAVVSVGYCGALQSGLRENEIVTPSEVVDAASGERYNCMALEPNGEVRTNGILLSQNRIAITAAEKQALGSSGAIAVDMESAGVAERTRRAGVPFSCIKVVSDRADESFGFDLNLLRSAEGRVARGKIVYHVLGHPALVPELFRLRRRTQLASRALGEFLVSCRIHFEGEPALAE